MQHLARMIRPWITSDGPEGLDSMIMEARDRTTNLGFFAAAAVVWVLVGLVVTTRDPVVDRSAGFVGAFLIGLAIALTLIPLIWLTIYGRHRQIAYRGDWTPGGPARRLGRDRGGRAGHPAAAGPPRAADRPVHDRPGGGGRSHAVRGTVTRGASGPG